MPGLCLGCVNHKRPLAFAVGAAAMLVLYFWFDREVAVWLQNHRADWLATLADWGSEFGEGYVVLVPSALVGVWFWLRGQRESASKSWRVFCCVGAAGLVALGTKVVLARWRPSRLPNAYGFEFFHFKSDQWSFPSGHVTTAAAAAVVMSLLFPRWRWVWWSYPLLVGVARLCAVAHFPSDVIGGAMIGAAAALWVNHGWIRLGMDRRITGATAAGDGLERDQGRAI